MTVLQTGPFYHHYHRTKGIAVRTLNLALRSNPVFGGLFLLHTRDDQRYLRPPLTCIPSTLTPHLLCMIPTGRFSVCLLQDTCLYTVHSHKIAVSPKAPWIASAMPQYHTATGTYSYADHKSAYPTFPRVGFGSAVAIGIGAGFIGAFAMAGTNVLEQLITHRPNSYVPARTIGNHFGVTPAFYDRHTDLLNHIHHHGMGMLAGGVRGVLSYYGIIGPVASFVHTGIRIMMDQVVENMAGTSALPWTWPINEQVIDVLHKGFYAIVTGYLCDYWIRGVNWFN